MSDSRIDLTDKVLPGAENLEDLALSDDYALNPAYVEMVIDAVDRDDVERMRELLDALHPADVADLMGFLSSDYREALLPVIDPAELADILSELDTGIREEVLEDFAPDALARALGELDSDDAADVLDDLDEDRRGAVLAAMSDVDRAAIETSLAYEDETAGRIMQREVLAAPQFWTVAQTLAHVRDQADDMPDLFFEVYVVDPSYRPVGAVPLSTLLKARPELSLEQVMEPVTDIGVTMDQEEVAYIFQKYHLISAPVTDEGGRLVGQITVDDIVHVIGEESEEDILALAGVSDAGRDATVIEVARSRVLWLSINILTAVLASSVIAIFQNEIVKLVSLAVLMPIVASMGGNAGTQTLTVAVRALATRELNAVNAMRIITREVTVGAMNGVVFALVMAAITLAWFHQPMLSLVVGLAMVVNLLAASLAGILVPLTLNRLGYDPAVSSSVFVTTVTDVVGFFTFLGLAALILL